MANSPGPSDSLESKRRRAIVAAVALLAAPLVVWLVIRALGIASPVAGLVVTFIVVAMVAFVAAHQSQSYRREFKRDIVSPLIARLHPRAIYRPGQGIAEAVTNRSCLLPSAPEFKSDDLVRVRIDDCAVQFSNVTLERWRSRRSGREYERVFSGLFLQVLLPRAYPGVTLLLPDGAQPRQKPEEGQFERIRGTRGPLDVWATESAAASAVIASSIPQAVARAAQTHELTVSAAVHDDRLSVAVDVGDLFEPGIRSATGSEFAVSDVEGTFAFATDLVRALEVSVPPQTASADLNLLFGDRVAADQGPTLARAARECGVDVDLRGSEVVLTYGWSVGLLSGLAVNALWVTLAVSLNGRVTGWPGNGSIVEELALSASLLDQALRWLSSHHPWSVLVLLLMPVGSLLLLRGQHPHHVAIARDSVQRTSRVWPGRQTMAIDEGAEVRFDQGAVVVGAPGRFGTRVSPPLSPHAGTAVARLVAGHLGVEVRLGSGPRGRVDGIQ